MSHRQRHVLASAVEDIACTVNEVARAVEELNIRLNGLEQKIDRRQDRLERLLHRIYYQGGRTRMAFVDLEASISGGLSDAVQGVDQKINELKAEIEQLTAAGSPDTAAAEAKVEELTEQLKDLVQAAAEEPVDTGGSTDPATPDGGTQPEGEQPPVQP